MDKSILSVESASIRYGKKIAAIDVSLSLSPAECVALVGTNGAGKSSLLRIISGIQNRTSGKFFFDNQEITTWNSAKCVEHGLILCPEGRQLFPRMSVFDNVTLGAYRRSISRRTLLLEFEALKEFFPVLIERKKQEVGTLSGGEQQMVALARALMGRPKLLLMDEPSLGLSPIMTETLFSIIKMIAGTGCAVLIAEQNIYSTLRSTTRAYVMESGVISPSYESAHILSNPQILMKLLGQHEK